MAATRKSVLTSRLNMSIHTGFLDALMDRVRSLNKTQKKELELVCVHIIVCTNTCVCLCVCA